MNEKEIALIKESFVEIENNTNVFLKTFYSRLYDLDSDKDKYLKGEVLQRREEIIGLLGLAISKFDDSEALAKDLEAFGKKAKELGLPQSSYSTVGVAFIDALAAVLEYHNLSQETTRAWTKAIKLFFEHMLKGAKY